MRGNEIIPQQIITPVRRTSDHEAYQLGKRNQEISMDRIHFSDESPQSGTLAYIWPKDIKACFS